jgi:hypothetical protein
MLHRPFEVISTVPEIQSRLLVQVGYYCLALLAQVLCEVAFLLLTYPNVFPKPLIESNFTSYVRCGGAKKEEISR